MRICVNLHGPGRFLCMNYTPTFILTKVSPAPKNQSWERCTGCNVEGR